MKYLGKRGSYGLAPNSYGRRVWSVARTSSKVKGRGHQGQKKAFSALSAACVPFMLDKTSLASSSDEILLLRLL